ncbi:Tn3 family transposase [Streptosporangium sp. NPDC023825]|uniref:Tn3 family transposase n=1 Tax=Streptosporangium sp. NPDC023825 TaxID=3154909 RepID=UPI0034483658
MTALPVSVRRKSRSGVVEVCAHTVRAGGGVPSWRGAVIVWLSSGALWSPPYLAVSRRAGRGPVDHVSPGRFVPSVACGRGVTLSRRRSRVRVPRRPARAVSVAGVTAEVAPGYPRVRPGGSRRGEPEAAAHADRGRGRRRVSGQRRPDDRPCDRDRHIDQLFSTDPRTAIDWDLLRRHWPDLMQVALSVKQGTVSSVTLLRRLNNRSRKNQIYQVFREVGRAVRTAVLLRYLSDPALREQIQRATNKAEAYNGFTKWLHFGNAGWLNSRDPELQDRAVKFLDLVAASVIFSTTIDMTKTLRQMAHEGWPLRASDLAVLSPYRRENVLRFGDSTTDGLHIPPHTPTRLQPGPPRHHRMAVTLFSWLCRFPSESFRDDIRSRSRACVVISVVIKVSEFWILAQILRSGRGG